MNIASNISTALFFLGSVVGCQSIELQRLDEAVSSKPPNKSRCIKIVKDRTTLYQKSYKERVKWLKKYPDAVFQHGECWTLYGGDFTAGDSLERVSSPNLFDTLYGQFEENNKHRKRITRLEQEIQKLEVKNNRLRNEKLEVETELDTLNRLLRGDTAHWDAEPEIVFP